MEQPKQNTAATILKYRKRRFDGGSEIELIRHIERQQTVAQLQRLQEKQRELEQAQFKTIENTITDNRPAPAPVQPLPVPQPAEAPAQYELKTSKKITEALVLGPLEICVGAVGIMTSLIAIFTFSRMKNAELVNQSKTVLKDCVTTFGKGFVDTAKGPFKALKLAVSK